MTSEVKDELSARRKGQMVSKYSFQPKELLNVRKQSKTMVMVYPRNSSLNAKESVANVLRRTLTTGRSNLRQGHKVMDRGKEKEGEKRSLKKNKYLSFGGQNLILENQNCGLQGKKRESL
jgi:hypothetical protein